MQFSEVLDALKLDQKTATVNFSDDWLQGRTAFGGLQAAVAVKAMRSLAPAAPLRTLQVTFIAPVPVGQCKIELRLLRQGKSAAHVEARMFDGGQLACLLVGIFGAARESKIALMPAMPALSAAQAPIRLPYIAGVMPSFTQHFSMRWADGGLPYSGAAEPRTRVLIRHLDPAPVSESHVIALADVIPSPALSTLKQPTMASSLTWTLELLTDRYSTDASRDWRIDADVTAAADGYINQTATLFDSDGLAVALSRQSVVVFA